MAAKENRRKAFKQVAALANPRTDKTPPEIMVHGRLDRLSHWAFQTSIYIPQDVRERVEGRLVQGSFSVALIGLVVWALDELDRTNANLLIKTGAVPGDDSEPPLL